MPDFSSQAFLFVDFSATPGGSAGVSLMLTTVKNVKVKDDSSTEVLTALGVLQGAGVREKQGGGTISMTQFQVVGKAPEVDWFAKKREKAWGTLTIQGEGGGRRVSFLVRVSKIDIGNDSDGVHEDEIELVYTKRYVS